MACFCLAGQLGNTAQQRRALADELLSARGEPKHLLALEAVDELHDDVDPTQACGDFLLDEVCQCLDSLIAAGYHVGRFASRYFVRLSESSDGIFYCHGRRAGSHGHECERIQYEIAHRQLGAAEGTHGVMDAPSPLRGLLVDHPIFQKGHHVLGEVADVRNQAQPFPAGELLNQLLVLGDQQQPTHHHTGGREFIILHHHPMLVGSGLNY